MISQGWIYMEFKPTSFRTGKVRSGENEYYVTYVPEKDMWYCNCDGYIFHKVYCKHIRFVKDITDWED